jgi:hypothetical protein
MYTTLFGCVFRLEQNKWLNALFALYILPGLALYNLAQLFFIFMVLFTK